MITWSASRLGLVVLLGFAYFVLVGLPGMIQASRMPGHLRLIHTVGILADSVVYSISGGSIVGAKKKLLCR